MGEPGRRINDSYRWLERAGRTIDSVCRVEINKNPAGTGFLVGPNSVLTNFHVIEDALGRNPGEERQFVVPVACRFDFGVRAGGGVSEGLLVTAHSACVDFSRYSNAEHGGTDPLNPPPTMDELDYALLTLERSIGDEPVPNGDPRRSRGWITLTDGVAEPAKDDPLTIVQHQFGGAKVHDTRAFRGINGAKNRYTYSAVTTYGSSGSPCLTSQWELVGLHHLGDALKDNGFRGAGTFNQGIPSRLIYLRLNPKHSAAIPPYDERKTIDRVDAVTSFVTVVRKDAAAAASLKPYEAVIQEAHRATQRLRVLKAAHDFLQNVQGQLPVLFRAARNLEDLRQGRERLEREEDVKNIVTPLQRRGAEVLRMRDSDGIDLTAGMTSALDWLEELAAEAQRIGSFPWADATTGSDALEAIEQVVRIRPAVLNALIVGQVENLPFGQLLEGFRAAAEVLLSGERSRDLAVGPQAFSDSWDTIKQGVKDHDSWQALDNDLWQLNARDLSEPGDDRRAFAKGWQKKAAPRARALGESAKDAPWSVSMMREVQTIETSLSGDDWIQVRRSFVDFHSIVTTRFAEVDQALLRLCQDVVAMGRSFASLIDEVR